MNVSGETKKLSFSFSNRSKTLSVPKKVQKNIGVEFIDSVEGETIVLKTKTCKTEEVKPLVIPVVGSKTAFDIIKERKEKGRPNLLDVSVTTTDSLDQLAASELLNDARRSQEQKEAPKVTVIKSDANSSSTRSTKEPTLEDYESVPVGEFGMAMLRGMGWNPQNGIGKSNTSTTKPTSPVLRPKGLGLGANQINATVNLSSEEADTLKLIKGSYVNVLAGKYTGHYGKVEGFDDDTGRLFIKLSLEENSVSLNEHIIKVVTEKEYNKNSRVINASKYAKYSNETDKCQKTSHKSKSHAHFRHKGEGRKRSRSPR